MDQLVDEIMARTGMTRHMAQEAAATTIKFLKDRLPSQAISQIDGVLAAAQTESTAEQVRSKIEGSFR